MGNQAAAQLLRKPGGDVWTAPRDVTLIRISGKHQGKLTGSGLKGKEDWIQAAKFNFAVKSPTDSATGAGAGRRQYAQPTFEKETDSATPVLLHALTNNEHIEQIEVQAFKGGQSTPYKSYLFKDARLTGFNDKVDKDGEVVEGKEVVTFTFGSYELTVGDRSMQDQWPAGR